MTSRTTAQFRALLANLPIQVQRQAADAYQLFRSNPHHPSLRFKSVNTRQPMYSVPIGIRHRALGVYRNDVIIWFWIGTHAEYEELLSRS
ncbi:MAG: hypothetical protein ACR2JY_16715 [Chloroflexota bacterium]